MRKSATVECTSAMSRNAIGIRLAPAPPACGPEPVTTRADDREKRKRAHLQPGQEDEIPPDDWLSTDQSDTGPVVQEDGVGEDHDRQDKVKGDEIRVELEQHDETAEHDLSCDAGNQPNTQQGEVAAGRGP